MPYIVLANTNIPSGTVQINDLQPNTSLAVAALDTNPQSGYVNQAENDNVVLQAAGTLDGNHRKGIQAYLVDHVEPGGAAFSTGSIIILAGSIAGDTITIGTGGSAVVFTAVASGAVAASQQFLAATGNTASAAATSLAAAVNNGATQTLFHTLMGTGNAISAVVDATPTQVDLTVTGNTGYIGDVALVTAQPAHYTLSGATLTRTVSAWTPAVLTATVTAIQARVAAGSSLTLSDLNTLLASNAGADFTGTTAGSHSVGVVKDFLSVLAGRGYWIYRYPAAATFGTPIQYMTSATQWNPGPHGSFTKNVKVNDTQMSNGEIRPVTIGGDTKAVEYRPIRYLSPSDSLYISMAGGTLAAFSKQPAPAHAPAVTLWPDNSARPWYPWLYQQGPQVATVTSARVVTVYNDDGSLLS
jgi:hypothetical protein